MKFCSLVRPEFLPVLFLTAVGAVSLSCTTAESKPSAAETAAASSEKAASAPKGASIDITTGGPADTVRAFYKLLREKKFREALFLTNLRPAIESLTDTELREFSLDFEAIAGSIPTEIEINGEIISGGTATVTANLPDPADESKKALQEIKLKQRDNVWVIQTADAETEARIRKDGKQFFHNYRIETHEAEAAKMLERVAKAQVAYSLQHEGECADLPTLIAAGLGVPEDIGSSASTGYNYEVVLSENRRRYYATATPAEYRRSGTRSFLLRIDDAGLPHVTSKDNGGKPLKN